MRQLASRIVPGVTPVMGASVILAALITDVVEEKPSALILMSAVSTVAAATVTSTVLCAEGVPTWEAVTVS